MCDYMEVDPVSERDGDAEISGMSPMMARVAAIPNAVAKFCSSSQYMGDAVFGSPTTVVDLSYWRIQSLSVDSIQERSTRAEFHQDDEDVCAVQNVPATVPVQRGADFLDFLTDDLFLQMMDFLDVKSAMFLLGATCKRHRTLAREWFPWRCMNLRLWVSVPNHRANLLGIYSTALASFDARPENSLKERISRRLSLAQFLGFAGWYRESEELLGSAVFHDADVETRADLLYTVALVKWRAQQARQGGDEDYLWSIVDAAQQSIELRRTMTGSDHSRKLALTLEVLAENAACYGHCLLSIELAGQDTGAAAREGARRMPQPFAVAEAAAAECVALWEELADDEKLADAWAASASVDFYTGRHFDRALGKLSVARAVCGRARLEAHATHALVLFNLAYISLVAFHRAADAAVLFSESLAVRERALGADHPFTAATRAELAACRRLLRRLGDAAGAAADGAAGGGGGGSGSDAEDGGSSSGSESGSDGGSLDDVSVGWTDAVPEVEGSIPAVDPCLD